MDFDEFYGFKIEIVLDWHDLKAFSWDLKFDKELSVFSKLKKSIFFISICKQFSPKIPKIPNFHKIRFHHI